MKKYLSFALALLMLLACFTACNNGNQNTSSTQPTDTSNTSTDASADVSGTTTVTYVADVPDVEYDGEQFVILTSYANDNPKRPEFGGMPGDEIVEDVVNTAIATRNDIVEDRLDIDIVEKEVIDTNRWGTGATYMKISTALSGGVLDFHMAAPSLFNSATLAQGGYLEDLMALEHLHELSEPWWYEHFVNEVELFGKVFYASGDISFYNFNATAAILFNKELFAEFEIEAPYSLVRNKEWTLDKLREIQTIGFSGEVEVDGKIDYKDKVAITTSNDMMWAQFFACGGRIVSKDEDGSPYLSIWSETNNNYIDKILEIMKDTDNLILADDYFSVVTWPGELLMEAFTTGRSLMHIASIDAIGATSEMVQEFGIVPYPLYDENQENYYSFLNPWVGDAVCIPYGHDDNTLEFISIVMETMGAEGKNEITPEFYEVALKRQKTRDDDSLEMLDIISATVGCDFGQNANLAGYPTMLHDLIKAPLGSFASKYQELETRANSQIDDIINAYTN